MAPERKQTWTFWLLHFCCAHLCCYYSCNTNLNVKSSSYNAGLTMWYLWFFYKFCCKLRRDALIHNMLSAASLNRKRWIRWVQSFTTCSSNFSNADKLIFTMMPRYDLITYLSSYGWSHKQWRVNMQSVLSMNFDLYNTINWPKLFSVLPSDCYCVRFQNALLNKNIGLEEKNLREYLEKVKMSSKPYILSSCLKIVLDRTWHRWSKVIKHQV